MSLRSSGRMTTNKWPCLQLFIRPKSDHCLPLSLTGQLTNSCFDLTDMTLAFEDVNSKLVDAASVADVYAEERVGDSLVEMLKFCKLSYLG